jgi:thiol-disulfide isomerase/thioredoxin
MRHWTVTLMIVTELALTARAMQPLGQTGQFGRARQELAAEKARTGVTSAYLEALSWLARGELDAKLLDAADGDAVETRRQALVLLKNRKLDADKSLPLALGASIEVQARVLDARGHRAEAVAFLKRELATWRGTSIEARIQKNINLIALVGHKAPALSVLEYVGPVKPPSGEEMNGKVVLLFFWAHWCGDCKADIPVLARLSKEYAARGLVVIAPTQPYGYTATEENVPRSRELQYIDAMREKYYSRIGGMSVPVSERNITAWGASTMPTLALIDRAGVVRMYTPGVMSEGELRPKIEAILGR